jgi:PAS domain S-box-containing protein
MAELQPLSDPGTDETVLHEISARLLSTSDYREVLDLIVHHAARLLRAGKASINLAEGGLLRTRAKYVEPGGYFEFLGSKNMGANLLPEDRHPDMYETLRTGRPRIVQSHTIHDLKERVIGAPVAERPDIFYMFEPLRVNGEVIGVAAINLDREELERATPRQRRLVRQLLDFAAIALSNAKLIGQLTSAKAELSTLIDSSVDGILAFDRECRYTVWNPGMETISGVSRAEALGRCAFDIFPFLKETGEDRFLHEALAGRVATSEDRPFEMPGTGRRGYFEAHYSPLVGDSGQVLGGLAVVRDITERKRAEEALRQSEERLKSLYELGQKSFASEKELVDYALEEAVRLTGSKVGYFHFLDSDAGSLELYTWSSQALKVCRASKDRHYPLTSAGVWVDCARTGRPAVHNDYQNLAERKGYPEGHVHIVRHMSVPILDNGKVVVVSGVANKDAPYDDTDVRQLICFMDGVWKELVRKRAEEALGASEERYALAQRAAGIGSWDWDILTGGLRWSETIEPMFGFAPGQFGRTYEAFLECVHPEDRQFVIDSVNACVEKGADYDIQHRVVWPDGSVRWMSETGDIIRDEGGRVVRMLGVVHDITERVRRQREIEEANRRLQEALDYQGAVLGSLEEAVLSLDTAGRIIYANPAACRTFGYSAEELHRMTICDLRLPGGPCTGNGSACLAKRLSAGVPLVEREVEYKTRTGQVIYGQQALSALRDHAGAVVGAVAVVDDFSSVRRLEGQAACLAEEIDELSGRHGLVAVSQPMQQMMKQVSLVAPTASSVLILGETGTGKELIARAIHEMSPRKGKPLVKVHCAALSPGLIESEFFGHEKGAFTGAVSRKIGRFELADGGTIFLDEVGDIPLETQVKLLRVLQEREFERVGGTRPIKVDVRIVAATNNDMEEAVRSGAFRRDLFYRLSVFPVRVPPLRERPGAIGVLAAHFAHSSAKTLGKQIDGISPESIRRLEAYSWPGNVRELRNVIERAAIISAGPVLTVQELDLAVGLQDGAAEGEPLDLEGNERHHILRVLERTAWRIEGAGGAAELLRVNPSTLRSRIKKLGLSKPAPGRDISRPAVKAHGAPPKPGPQA